MKQTKWQRLAAIGLCGSLLVNAFSGVTAVAETVTIESSPTAESSAKEETQASSETQETTTETSREEVTQETEKQAEVAVEKKEAPPVKAEQKEAEDGNQSNSVPMLVNGLRSLVGNTDNYGLIYDELANFLNRPRVDRYEIALSVPELNLGFNVEETNGTPVNATDFNLSASINFLQSIPPNTTNAVSIDKENVLATKESNSLNFKLPSKTIVTYSDPYINHSYNFYYLDKMNLTVPKYVNSIDVSGDITQLLSTTGNAQTLQMRNPAETSIAQITMTKINDLTFSLSTNPGMLTHFYENAQTVGTVPYLLMIGYNRPNSISLTASVAFPKTSPKIIVDLKKVTENFVDATGAKITPPTGFTQGQQTSITSNDFTYTSAKALPDTYKAGGKTYKFKGWYKGTDKTALKTTKTPSYAVTYDDQDDMTAVYEVDTGKDYNFPSKTVNFQFIDEAGTIISPTPFTITTDLQQEINSTYTKLGSITGINSGNTKRVTIPAKTIRADVSLGGVNNYGTTNTRITIPKFYENISVYTGSAYTQATLNRYSTADNTLIGNPTSNAPLYYGLNKMTTTQFKVSEYDSTTTIPEQSEYLYNRLYVSGASRLFNSYVTPVGTIYYQLTNRKVTENFVDATGAKITPPTGFTQGNKVVIDSENFTYTSAKALPDTYTVGDKNYKFKGWYKGTDQTKMKTTKTPSYAVTYDDKDDMTAVYEEVQEITVHPGFYAEFVDEQGQAFTNPLTLSGNYTEFFRKTATSPFEATGSLYPMVGSKEATVANRYKVETKQNVLIPNDYELFSDLPTGVLNKGFALNNFDITNELKYVDKVEATTKTITLYDYETISDIGTNLLSDSATTSFTSFETVFNRETNNTFSVKARWGQSGLTRDVLPSLLFLTSANSQPRLFGFDGTSNYKQTINYKVTRKQVTENFVDATGAKITPPTGFTQGKQTPMTSNSFTYTSAKALPATYTVGDKNYKFKGWYKGTDKTALKTTKTPSYAVTYDDKDDMTAVYEEVQATAEMTVSRLLEVVSNEASMIWTVRLKNTSEVPLTNVKLAPTAKWAAGISAPTQLAVRLGNTPNKIIPVTAEQWRTGVNLGVEIPVNGEALVTVNTAKITGEPRQLLTAEMTASGNFSAVTASNFVRIQGEDQTIEPTPAEEGFISMPTFDFGKIMISGSTKQYSLKKAADYYGNGTRNPYLRIKKSQPNWQLTAQLSQLKASTDSLPTSTRLLLGNADVAAIENYNQVTELTNKVGITEPLALTSDGTSTPVILTNQFTGNDVYQLEFDFASVKLEVTANQGKINEKYQGTVTWNLVTGP
ncbi:WxL domain-containing protein [Enterococcus faecalis]|uniref:WxL domain-containing protein n=1 Tax=Enterococcus faecalis TaxID=1351 RepID=UPI0025B1C304|nr:WxL domain-containing protein [Enterococcus faecalis]MDN3187585.1 WxL domain-containing protein [Enterococcus faecalis]